MSVHVSSACWQIALPSTQKLVLISLADQANDEGVCWPSVDNLTRRTGLSDRGVQKALRELEQAGLIQRTERHGRSNSYRLPVIHTPEPRSPRTTFTPEPGSPPPPNHVHPTPEPRSPRTVIEPSVESKTPPPSPPSSMGGRRAKRSETPKTAGRGQWWLSEAATEAVARELGMRGRGGESWHDFRGRIRARLAQLKGEPDA